MIYILKTYVILQSSFNPITHVPPHSFQFEVVGALIQILIVCNII